MTEVRSKTAADVVVRYAGRRLRIPAEDWVEVNDDVLDCLISKAPDEIEIRDATKKPAAATSGDPPKPAASKDGASKKK